MSTELKNKTPRKKSTTRKTPTSASLKNQKKDVPSESEVRERAFEIFISRGAAHGHDTEDWVRAEQELRRN